METHSSFVSFRMVWLLWMLNFGFSSQAQYIQSSNNKNIRINTFKFQRVDNDSIQIGVLYSLTDSTLAVVDAKELVSFIEKWKLTHGGLLPLADTLQKILELSHIAYRDLQWIKMKKMPAALVGLLTGGAVGGVAVIAGGIAYGNEGAAIVAVTLFVPITLLGTIIGAVAIKRTIYNNESEKEFRQRLQKKWRKRTIQSQLQKMYSKD